MGIGTRTGRWWRAALLLATGAVAGGAALAVAGVPDSSGVIHACVKQALAGTPAGPYTGGPNVRIVDPSLPGQSCSTDPASPTGAEQGVSWNQVGISGNVGPPGQNGPAGPTGPAGPAGRTATVVSGQTLTLAGGQVITVSGATSPSTPQLLTPPGKPSGNGLTLNIDGMTVPLLSFSQLINRGSTTGSAARRATLPDIVVTRKLDKSSPKLAQACATGKHFSSATLTVRKAGKGTLSYKLAQVLISAYQVSGAGKNQTPTESVTLNFTKISLQYAKQ